MRMLSAASQLSFAVFVAALYHTAQPGECLSHYNLNTVANLAAHELGFGNHTRCSWNCTVIESDLPKEKKNAVVGRFELVIKYVKRVDEKCVNQTSQSSEIATENWQIQHSAERANNKLPTLANAMKSVFKMIRFEYSESGQYSYCCEEHNIKAVCSFKPARTTATSPTDLRIELKRTIQEMDSLQHYIIIRTKKEEWAVFRQDAFYVFHFVFILAFTYYSPAVLCLLSPTIVTENGIRQIVLEGASPVCLRALIGNYLFSEDETIWRHRATILIIRLVIMPLTFLPTAIQFYQITTFAVYLNFSHPFMIVCCACYFIQAVYESFFVDVSREARPCFFCRDKKIKITCNDVLPRRILNHLRIQPLLLVEYWLLIRLGIVSYFKMSKIILPASWKVSAVWVFRISLFIIFLFTIPAVTIMLLAAMLSMTFVAFLFTSPTQQILCNGTIKVSDRSFSSWALVFVRFCLTSLAMIAAGAVLYIAARGTLFAILVAFTFLLFEESLPYVTCYVLVWYYLGNSYSFFTNKYHDLSLTLFKCYKESARHDQISDEELHTDASAAQENTSSDPDNKSIAVRIPKELFDMACEQLMPIREGVCILILKVTLMLSFVFLAFLLITWLNVGATPVTKALVAFFIGLLPKIIAIYFDGERQKAMIIEEKCPKIVQKYINGTQRANQDDDDDEVVESQTRQHEVLFASSV